MFLFTFYTYKGAGAKRWHDDKGGWGEGVWIPPKSDDVIYEQPPKYLTFSQGAFLPWYLENMATGDKGPTFGHQRQFWAKNKSLHLFSKAAIGAFL